MQDFYTVSFFGHRDFYGDSRYENKLNEIILNLLEQNEYVEFLVGRNGGFDQFTSSCVTHIKRKYAYKNCSLVCVLPYETVEHKANRTYFENYYDEIEVCEESSLAHFKSAIQIRNRHIIDRSDLIICFLKHCHGGAFQSIKYAQKQEKNIINLAETIF